MRTNVVPMPVRPALSASEIAQMVAEAREASIKVVREFEIKVREMEAQALAVAALELAPIGVRETARVLADQVRAAADRVAVMVRGQS